MRRTFFDTTPTDVDLLEAGQAVDVLRQLIWEEAARLSISFDNASIPFCINNADGGIDATMRVPPGTEEGLLFSSPVTCFQVKTGKLDIKPSSIAEIKKLFIKPSAIEARKRNASRSKDDSDEATDPIKPRVRECLDEHGTFALFLFGEDGTPDENARLVSAMQGFISSVDPKYKDARIKVWRQSQICDLIEKSPAIALMVREQAGFPLRWFDRWKATENTSMPYIADSERERQGDELGKLLRGPIPKHVRILGAPGSGKSRWLLEALSSPSLKPQVLFAASPSDVSSNVVAALVSSRAERMILVVDRCDIRESERIVDAVAGQPIVVISIGRGAEDELSVRTTHVFDIEPLSDSVIETLLRRHVRDDDRAKLLAPFCDGSPLIVEALAELYARDPEDPLREFEKASVWGRFLREGENTEILCTLAIADRFEPAQIEKHHEALFGRPGKALEETRATIALMKRRGILVGKEAFSLRPRALHAKLWIDWWTRYSSSSDLTRRPETFLNLPGLDFGGMFEFACLCDEATRFAVTFLGQKERAFDSGWLNTAAGSRLFRGLARAVPYNAIDHLQTAFAFIRPSEGFLSIVETLEGM